LAGLARAGVRVQLPRALLPPVVTGAAMTGLLVALPLPTIADVAAATALVALLWLVFLGLRDPQQRWRNPSSLIGRMGGSVSEDPS
jgi:hypothetical protein